MRSSLLASPLICKNVKYYDFIVQSLTIPFLTTWTTLTSDPLTWVSRTQCQCQNNTMWMKTNWILFHVSPSQVHRVSTLGKLNRRREEEKVSCFLLSLPNGTNQNQWRKKSIIVFDFFLKTQSWSRRIDFLNPLLVDWWWEEEIEE